MDVQHTVPRRRKHVDVQSSKQLTEIARQKISQVYEIIDQNDNIQL